MGLKKACFFKKGTWNMCITKGAMMCTDGVEMTAPSPTSRDDASRTGARSGKLDSLDSYVSRTVHSSNGDRAWWCCMNLQSTPEGTPATPRPPKSARASLSPGKAKLATAASTGIDGDDDDAPVVPLVKEASTS